MDGVIASQNRAVFRDETILSASPGLWGEIEKAIDASARRILLASPPSTRSTWIPRELEHFVARRGAKQMCVALTMGKTRYTDPGEIAEAEAALAPATTARFGADEPLVVDLRPFRAAPRRARRLREYVDRVATIASFVSNRDKDELFSEHIARQRRWVWFLTVTAIVVAVLAGVAIQQTFAERAATRRATAGEHAARVAQRRAERLRAITEIQLRTTQARLLAREEPHVALAMAAKAWAERPVEPAEIADDDVERFAERTRAEAAAALGEVLGAHPGLRGHLHGHAGTIRMLGIDGGGTLISAAADGRIFVWDLAKRERQRELVHPAGRALLNVAREGALVAAASEGDVVIWRGSGAPGVYPVSNVASIAIRRSGNLVALGTGAGEVLLLDPTTGALHLLDSRDGSVAGLTFSADGSQLYVGRFSQDNQVDIWDITTRRRVGPGLRGHHLAATAIVPSADGARIAAATEMDEVIVWDRRGKVLARWTPRTTVTGVAFSPRGDRVYSVQADGTLMAWDLADPSGPKHSRYAHRGGAYAIAIDPATGLVITGGTDGAIRLWDPEPAPVLLAFVEGSVGYGVRSCFDDADRIAALGPTGVRRWSTDAATCTDLALTLPVPMEAIAFAGELVIAEPPWDSADRTLLGWSTRTNQRVTAVPETHRMTPTVVLSSDARVLVRTRPGAGGGLWRWDLRAATAIRHELGAVPADALAFDPAGLRLAAALADGDLVVWDTAAWREQVRARIESSDKVTALALPRTGEHLAVGRLRGDLEIRGVDPRTTLHHRLTLYRDPVAALAFHPGGSWLTSSDQEGHIALVDAATGTVLAQVEAPTRGSVQGLTFDAAGKRLLVSLGDRLALVATDPDRWAELAMQIASGPGSIPSQ